MTQLLAAVVCLLEVEGVHCLCLLDFFLEVKPAPLGVLKLLREFLLDHECLPFFLDLSDFLLDLHELGLGLVPGFFQLLVLSLQARLVSFHDAQLVLVTRLLYLRHCPLIGPLELFRLARLDTLAKVHPQVLKLGEGRLDPVYFALQMLHLFSCRILVALGLGDEADEVVPLLNDLPLCSPRLLNAGLDLPNLLTVDGYLESFLVVLDRLHALYLFGLRRQFIKPFSDILQSFLEHFFLGHGLREDLGHLLDALVEGGRSRDFFQHL